MTVFEQQKAFMRACGQGERFNLAQATMYMDLVDEERDELSMAFTRMVDYMGQECGPYHEVMQEVVDGAIDTIYVCIGLLHSLGLDPQPFWDEVQRSNMSKAVPVENPDGTVTMAVKRREDGKILKPATFSRPDILPIIKEQLGE